MSTPLALRPAVAPIRLGYAAALLAEAGDPLAARPITPEVVP